MVAILVSHWSQGAEGKWKGLRQARFSVLFDGTIKCFKAIQFK